MGHQVRLLMEHGTDLLTGVIEADETYIGNNPKNLHKSRYKESLGRGKEKVPVIAVVQRGGEVRAKVMDGVNSNSIYSVITQNVDKSSTLITDAFSSYKWVGKQFNHISIKHNDDFTTIGANHTNTVEGFFSHLKRTIKGTHIHVSRKHMQKYANECSFRYSHRNEGQMMFNSILGRVVL